MMFSLSKGKLLALDWDKTTLRLVLVRPRADGVDLLRAVSIAIPDDVKTDDAAAFGAFVREAASRTHAGTKRAVLAIPRDHVVLNNLSLPPTPPEEMPSLVQFQVAKELPFAAEQATLDFAVNGEFDPKAPSSVLVSAVRTEVLAYYKSVAREAGLLVERIGLRPFANLIAVTAGAAELADKTLLIVEIGPQFTEIDIIRQGQILFSRSASVQLPDREPATDEAIKDSRIVTVKTEEREEDDSSRRAVGDLMVEIVRSVEAYRATDPALGLEEIIVCGATGLETHLVQSLAARFATRAVLYSPDRALQLTPERARELRGFNAALGLAIGHARKGISTIDFLHPKKSVSRRAMRMRKMPLAVATAALFLGSGAMFHFRFVRPKTAEAKRLDVLRAQLKKQEEPIVVFKERVEALEAWVESEQHWPEALASVTEIFPPETEGYVTRLDFETAVAPKSALREASMKLRFRTASLGTVNALATKLRESGIPAVVPGKETPSNMSGDGYRFDTNIDAGVPPKRAESAPEADSAEVKPASNGADADKPAGSEAKTVEKTVGAEAGKADKSAAGPTSRRASP